MIGLGATDEIMVETIGCYKIIGSGWFLIGPLLQKNGQIIITKRLITEIGEYRFLPGYLYAFRCWSLYKRLTVGLLGFLNECQFSSSYRYLLWCHMIFIFLGLAAAKAERARASKDFIEFLKTLRTPAVQGVADRCKRLVSFVYSPHQILAGIKV